jgi:DNA-binding transcriptional ArsR family regulator
MDEQAWRLYEMKADVFRAIAHPIRLAVMDCLRDGERCVCEITEIVGAERSNVSRHLAVMVRAGVLASRKEGLPVYYRLRTPCLLNVFTCVNNALKEQAAENAALVEAL